MLSVGHTGQIVSTFWKCRVWQLLLCPEKEVRKVIASLPNATARSRYGLVHAMLAAWEMTCNQTNALHAFQVCGLCPFSVEKATQNQWVRHADPDDPIWREWSHTPELPAMLDLRDGLEAITNLAEVLNYEK